MPRHTDYLWDVLEAELGEVTNRAERGRRNKALADIRESLGIVKPSETRPEHGEELRRRILRYRGIYPEMAATATAIAANWHTLTPERPRSYFNEQRRLRAFTTDEDRLAKIKEAKRYIFAQGPEPSFGLDEDT